MRRLDWLTSFQVALMVAGVIAMVVVLVYVFSQPMPSGPVVPGKQ